ncbi:hypothetical protein EGK74_01805 [Neisseria weixii]|uniref:Uncharacterized protein n=1 Tax=Neisseria weixii TaxID=1853276 RepID=A0A3N4NEF2_9NEIS|nr:hypothetical protein [Neisseria weixii]RPD90510.1 hypothetical protein EGK74_01805 [Neisseria weixii]
MAKAKDPEQTGLLSENQAENPTETPSAPPTDSQAIVKARVLVNGIYGDVNDIVEVPEVIAEHTPDLDADPAAVAYAESLQNEYA